MKKTILAIAAFTLLNANHTKAQELETILLAKEDAGKLTGAYIAPVTKGLIYSMNNGWYHTAKVHKKFGFDVTIAANASFIPSEDELFNLTKIGLSDATTYNQNTSSTIGGSENANTAIVTYTGEVQGQNVSVDFQMPSGIKEDLPASAVPAPSIQVAIGLPYKLEAIVRYLPKTGSDDVKAGLFGIGFKKEITDWFGPMDKTPLHISLLAAYTNMNVDYNIGDVSGNVTSNNAAAEFNLNSYTIQAIASINLPIINFYGGVGFNGGNTTLKMLGDYTLTYETGNPLNPTIQETVTDPLSLKTTANGFNATIGTRLSLGFFKLFGSYTLQEYNSINAGIAFSFR